MGKEVDNNQLQDILSKITGPAGFNKLIIDTENEIKKYKNKIDTLEKQIEQIKKLQSQTCGSLQTLEKMYQILLHLREEWGLSGIFLNREINKETRELETEEVITIDPETQARKEEGKYCMYKDRETKKWCPIKLNKKQKDKGSEYCTKHHAFLYGEDEENE